MNEAIVYLREDTIAAAATPAGRGAVAIIRISGPDALSICRRVFHSRRKDALDCPRVLSYGALIDPQTGELVDDCLCVSFPAPRSYTGEEMAEIHCHGGDATVRKILDILYTEHARPAEPGEFTFRAVRNGKMDLSQAEAVASLIDSRSQLARGLSLRMLEGAFSKNLYQLKEELTSILVEIETQVEFPDEAVEESLGSALENQIADALDHVIQMNQRAVRQRRFERGIEAILVGRPNVGKSSLFNRLLGRERAIVTPHPGTTRDSLEGAIDLQGRPVTLIDTAGLRETQEEIESLGVKRARELLTTSHLILFICEANMGLLEEDKRLLQEIQQFSKNSNMIIVANKLDLCANAASLESFHQEFPEWPLITASATKETGLDGLLSKMEEQVSALVPIDADSAFLINTRQERCLNKLTRRITDANHGAQQNVPLELIAEDIKNALDYLSKLDGTNITPDIINTIFSRFCIGK